MANGGVAKQFTLDTNILYDLAEGLDRAHEFREVFQAKGYGLCVPPTALGELRDAQLHGDEREHELATKALHEMLAWRLRPLADTPQMERFADRLARRLIHQGLRPASEKNDGRILGETSVTRIPILATKDSHLLDSDSGLLAVTFAELGMFPAAAFHPSDLLRAVLTR